MIEHKITENIVQSGASRTGHLVCSCGVETHKEDLTKTPLNVLRAQLAHMHKQVNPETRKVVRLPKKSKNRKTIEIESTENDPEIDKPEEPEGGWLND